MRYKYKTGESVTLATNRMYDTPPLGVFQVVRLLYTEQGSNQYRIRSITDGHERVAVEIELSKWTPG